MIKENFMVFLVAIICGIYCWYICNKETEAQSNDDWNTEKLYDWRSLNKIVTLEEKRTICNKGELDKVLLNSLDKISVKPENIKSLNWANYRIKDFMTAIDAFVETDMDIVLRLHFVLFDFNCSWSCCFIMNADNYNMMYYTADEEEFVNLYDYKTQEIIARRRMTYEEYMEKMSKK